MPYRANVIEKALNCYNKFILFMLFSETHNWETMVGGVQNYIRSLNSGYRVALNNANVTYLNEAAEFVNNHCIKVKIHKHIHAV